MVVFQVFEDIKIKSHKGEYSVSFNNQGIYELNNLPKKDYFFIIDKKIANLYKHRIDKIIGSEKIIYIEAKEENKSLDKFPAYIEELVKLKIRRGQFLIAIGGGIIQDITCFLAATLMRGLPWIFYPTTLLAQSDSCIGSKSSINSGQIKNILGTFTPPESVIIDVDFLKTLNKSDINSGIGEMLKVHAINSPDSFDKIDKNYNLILNDFNILENFIYNSLLMKKSIIEIDEFDVGPRNVMNYGHSFGHAIETATKYEIPHGIAVTIGMDIANFVASELGISNITIFNKMHDVLQKNSFDYRNVQINSKSLLNALAKDKKNIDFQLKLILPDHNGNITIGLYDNDYKLESAIYKYFEIYRETKI